MKLGVCLSGLLRIHLSLRGPIVFLDVLFLILVHSMLDVILPLFGNDMCSPYDHNITSCQSYACYPKLDSSLPLAQCTRFEVGEPFRLVARFDVDAGYCESGDTFR